MRVVGAGVVFDEHGVIDSERESRARPLGVRPSALLPGYPVAVEQPDNPALGGGSLAMA